MPDGAGTKTEGSAAREAYTMGYDEVAVAMMASRTAQSHAAFLIPHLGPGQRVLDCGCGPGTITSGFAAIVGPDLAIGVEIEPSQVALARETSRRLGVAARFEVADVYELPFDGGSFDRVHVGAVLMNLQDPLRALREIHRVLKPGGAIGVREGNQAGDLLSPPDPILEQGMALYTRLRQQNGHDPFVGGRLRGLLHEAGFERVDVSATYESYGTPDKIRQLAMVWAAMITRSNIGRQIVALGWADEAALAMMAAACTRFGERCDAFAATAWCEGVAWKGC